MTEGRSYFLGLRPCNALLQARLLGDELPLRLYPVPYLLGLPLQRLELGKHLSISGTGRLVGARGTALEVVGYVTPFSAHRWVFAALITKYSTLLLSTLLCAALGTATSLQRRRPESLGTPALYIVTLARLILRLLDTIPNFVYHPCSGIIACNET
jgi:hypothetical protein